MICGIPFSKKASRKNYLALMIDRAGCIIDAVTSSGILKAKQKLGVTFNSDKLGGIDF